MFLRDLGGFGISPNKKVLKLAQEVPGNTLNLSIYLPIHHFLIMGPGLGPGRGPVWAWDLWAWRSSPPGLGLGM